uniref:Uncharacterized protein n=1 Tax=Oryza glaberrima TaxID=4538 RepID=I1PE97_ORYGL
WTLPPSLSLTMLTGGGDNGKVEMRWCWRMRMRHHGTWKKWIYQRLGWELLPFFLCNHCDTDRQALLRRIHRQQPWKHRIYLLWATEWRSAAKEDLVFALEEDLHAQQLITSSNFKRRGQVLGGGSGGGLDAAVLLPHDGANELADGVASLAASGSLNLGASSLDLAAGATTAAVPLPLPSSRALAADPDAGSTPPSSSPHDDAEELIDGGLAGSGRRLAGSGGGGHNGGGSSPPPFFTSVGSEEQRWRRCDRTRQRTGLRLRQRVASGCGFALLEPKRDASSGSSASAKSACGATVPTATDARVRHGGLRPQARATLCTWPDKKSKVLSPAVT